VIAAITPFNFPLNLVAHKLGPAIAAGCPVVLKPAPQTPLSALALVQLLIEAGLPEDWISTLCDRRAEAAAPLVDHEIPALITFTGSAKVGHAIARAAAPRKVCLELGSNAPVLVMPGVDLAALAPRIAAAACGFAGQSCISVQRVLAHAAIADELERELVRAVSALSVGDPALESTEVGPMISAGECKRVLSWIEEARAAGGRVLAGGTGEGAICQPAVLAGAPRDTRVHREEIFGPALVISRCTDLRSAVAEANDSRFGIHAGVFTGRLDDALYAARELEFGGVLINEVPTYRADQQPYGGVRDSGNTFEGPHFSLREMTRIKLVSLQSGETSP
jgi:acyl-CoA reductase-like NAD-dependent aldehyde dehydrogenase